MADVTASRIESISDLGEGDDATWSYWSAQEKIALKAEKQWRKRGVAIVKRYRDERGGEAGVGASSLHRFNILWSNVQTLIPVLYGRTPKPDVDRRFKDQDAVGRFASSILERCLEYSMERHEFDDVMKAVVEDKCLPGRGTARVLYVPHFGDPIPGSNPEWEADSAAASVVASPGDGGSIAKGPAPLASEGAAAPLPQQPPTANQMADAPREVIYEEACLEYVYWEDYLEGPARTWRQVPWVRYRAYLTRKELVDRFGKQIGNKVKLDFTAKGTDRDDEKNVPDDLLKKAVVHETWDRTRQKVFWWAPGTTGLILDQKDDPLELPGFYPSANPLSATTTTSQRIPVADYIEYQDQAQELDVLTMRIDKLTKALKVAGVYAGSEKQVLQQLVEDAGENRLIPVEDWASFSIDKGGLQNLIQWMPIKQIADTLIALYDARDKVKQIIYEITGLADIMRGASSPIETATAQALKAAFSQTRTGPQQRDVAKFAKRMIQLMASLIMQQFDPKTISMITGFPTLVPVPPMPQQPQLPPAPPAQILGRDPQTGAGMMVPNPALQQYQQMATQAQGQYQQAVQAIQAVQVSNQQEQAKFDAAVKLLRDDAHEGFRIDIEADSTILPDEVQEKADRTEFLAKFVPLMEQVVPIAQGNPPMAAMAKELILFAVRGFKVARPLEESIEKAFDAIAKMPPQPNKHTVETEKTKVELQEVQFKAQADRQKEAMQQQEQQASLEFRDKQLQTETGLKAADLMLDAKKLDEESASRHIKDSAVEARRTRGMT